MAGLSSGQQDDFAFYYDNNSYGGIEPGLPKSSIPLQTGWNLISFSTASCWYDTEAAPIVPLPAGTELRRVASLKEVLSSINGKYLMIHSFDNEGGHTFDPELDTQGFNDLHYLAPGYGYWIKMAEPGIFELSGPQLEPSATLSLHSGWNLIGYWGREAKYDTPLAPQVSLPDGVSWEHTSSLKEVLTAISGKYSLLSSFDHQGGHTFDPGLDGKNFNDLHYLAPGYGYRIKMDDPGELRY